MVAPPWNTGGAPFIRTRPPSGQGGPIGPGLENGRGAPVFRRPFEVAQSKPAARLARPGLRLKMLSISAVWGRLCQPKPLNCKKRRGAGRPAAQHQRAPAPRLRRGAGVFAPPRHGTNPCGVGPRRPRIAGAPPRGRARRIRGWPANGPAAPTRPSAGPSAPDRTKGRGALGRARGPDGDPTNSSVRGAQSGPSNPQ